MDLRNTTRFPIYLEDKLGGERDARHEINETLGQASTYDIQRWKFVEDRGRTLGPGGDK